MSFGQYLVGREHDFLEFQNYYIISKDKFTNMQNFLKILTLLN
jgi:hypothetical protein